MNPKKTVKKLLESELAQWLYRCIQTHDKARGTLRTLQKEDLQRKITRPLELGSDNLLEDDQYLKNVIFDLQ